jgi:hypothetical protein
MATHLAQLPEPETSLPRCNPRGAPSLACVGAYVLFINFLTRTGATYLQTRWTAAKGRRVMGRRSAHHLHHVSMPRRRLLPPPPNRQQCLRQHRHALLRALPLTLAPHR